MANRIEAKKPMQHFVSYLKERNVYYVEDVLEGTPRITMLLTG